MTLIYPASRSDAIWVAQHLQDDDRRELQRIRAILLWKLLFVFPLDLSDNPVTFRNPRGEICGIAGVSRTDAHCGAIWMLTTPHVRPYPKLFFKEAKKWVEQQTSYEMLHNIADPLKAPKGKE
jgi:hypothetical protein